MTLLSQNTSEGFYPKVVVGGFRIEDKKTEPVTSLFLLQEKTKQSWLVSLLPVIYGLAFSFVQ